MKTLVKLSVLVAALAACSSENLPTPQKLSVDVKALPPYAMIQAVAQEDLPAPKNAQIIEQQTTFKVDARVLGERNQVLIKKGAIVSGMYTNDGVTCKIVWKSLYTNKKEFDHNRGTFTLGEVAEPTSCNPVKGIEEGQIYVIRVNSALVPPKG
ncbi:MAG: hypothetical protein K0R49_1629 [Burkholderiales bacterium]|jgi:hypothetical protein|nr:hypothetical protein [Burkholderiales bacterium]MCE3269375.1 hypothetical protein [Burkholderiales bacterium]